MFYIRGKFMFYGNWYLRSEQAFTNQDKLHRYYIRDLLHVQVCINSCVLLWLLIWERIQTRARRDMNFLRYYLGDRLISVVTFGYIQPKDIAYYIPFLHCDNMAHRLSIGKFSSTNVYNYMNILLYIIYIFIYNIY